MYRFDPAESLSPHGSTPSNPQSSSLKASAPVPITGHVGAASSSSGEEKYFSPSFTPPKPSPPMPPPKALKTSGGRSGLGFYVGEVGNLLPEPMRAYIPEPLMGAAAATDARLLVLWKEFHKFNNRLYLFLGLLQGIQIYEIPDDVERSEVDPLLVGSYYSGCVADASFVGTETRPSRSGNYVSFYSPAIALTSAEDSADFPRHTVKFISLKTGVLFDERRFRSRVHGLRTGASYFIIGLKSELHLYDSASLTSLAILKSYPNPPNYLLADLNARWLAYASRDPIKTATLNVVDKKSEYPSVSVSGIAKGIAAGLYNLGDAAINWYFSDEEVSFSAKQNAYQEVAGNVVIRDIKSNKVMIHFKAHEEALSLVKFDSSGTLIVTAPISGKYLNVYQVIQYPHNQRTPSEPVICKHLYRINRGITESLVRHISFSVDGRWLAVNSQKGSAHIYALNRCGGKVLWNAANSRFTLTDEFYQPKLEELNQVDIMKHKYRGSIVSAFETQSLAKYPVVVSSIWDLKPSEGGIFVFTMHSSGSKPDKLSLYLIRPTSASSEMQNAVKIEEKELRKWNMTDFVSKAFQCMDQGPDSFQDRSAEGVQTSTLDDPRGKWMSEIELKTCMPRNSFVPLWNSPRFSFHKLNPAAIKENESPFLNKYESMDANVTTYIEDIDQEADLAEPGMEIYSNITNAIMKDMTDDGSASISGGEDFEVVDQGDFINFIESHFEEKT